MSPEMVTVLFGALAGLLYAWVEVRRDSALEIRITKLEVQMEERNK